MTKHSKSEPKAKGPPSRSGLTDFNFNELAHPYVQLFDNIGGRARINRRNLFTLRDTERARLLKLNDTVLEFIDRCPTSKAATEAASAR